MTMLNDIEEMSPEAAAALSSRPVEQVLVEHKARVNRCLAFDAALGLHRQHGPVDADSVLRMASQFEAYLNGSPE